VQVGKAIPMVGRWVSNIWWLLIQGCPCAPKPVSKAGHAVRDALPGHFRQGLTETIVGQEAIGRIRAGEGILQSIPGDHLTELTAIPQDPALGVEDFGSIRSMDVMKTEFQSNVKGISTILPIY
jgi:hypothetical protein